MWVSCLQVVKQCGSAVYRWLNSVGWTGICLQIPQELEFNEFPKSGTVVVSGCSSIPCTHNRENHRVTTEKMTK